MRCRVFKVTTELKMGTSTVIGLFRILCLEAQDKQWKLNFIAIREQEEDQCGPVCFSKINQVVICRYRKGQSLKSGLLGSKPMKLYIKDLPKLGVPVTGRQRMGKLNGFRRQCRDETHRLDSWLNSRWCGWLAGRGWLQWGKASCWRSSSVRAVTLTRY